MSFLANILQARIQSKLIQRGIKNCAFGDVPLISFNQQQALTFFPPRLTPSRDQNVDRPILWISLIVSSWCFFKFFITENFKYIQSKQSNLMNPR